MTARSVHILLFLLFSFRPVLTNAQDLVIENARTGAPIPYCNVQLIGDGFGKVSGPSGRLALPDSFIERMDEGDSLLFSSVGYQDLMFGKKGLQEKLHGEGRVKLIPKSIQKDSVTVKGYQKTDVLLGKKLHNEVSQVGFGVSKAGNGYEMGSLIKVRRPFTELDTFGFYITHSSSPQAKDSVLIRLNLYDIDEEDSAQEEVDSLINDSLISFRIPMEEGGFTIDLSEQHITVQEDFLATIEVLEKSYKGQGWLHFSARTFGGTGFDKFSFGGKWEKRSMGAPAFYFKGRMPTWIESLKLKDELPGRK